MSLQRIALVVVTWLMLMDQTTTVNSQEVYCNGEEPEPCIGCRDDRLYLTCPDSHVIVIDKIEHVYGSGNCQAPEPTCNATNTRLSPISRASWQLSTYYVDIDSSFSFRCEIFSISDVFLYQHFDFHCVPREIVVHFATNASYIEVDNITDNAYILSPCYASHYGGNCDTYDPGQTSEIFITNTLPNHAIQIESIDFKNDTCEFKVQTLDGDVIGNICQDLERYGRVHIAESAFKLQFIGLSTTESHAQWIFLLELTVIASGEVNTTTTTTTTTTTLAPTAIPGVTSPSTTNEPPFLSRDDIIILTVVIAAVAVALCVIISIVYLCYRRQTGASKESSNRDLIFRSASENESCPSIGSAGTLAHPNKALSAVNIENHEQTTEGVGVKSVSVSGYDV